MGIKEDIYIFLKNNPDITQKLVKWGDSLEFEYEGLKYIITKKDEGYSIYGPL